MCFVRREQFLRHHLRRRGHAANAAMEKPPSGAEGGCACFLLLIQLALEQAQIAVIDLAVAVHIAGGLHEGLAAQVALVQVHLQQTQVTVVQLTVAVCVARDVGPIIRRQVGGIERAVAGERDGPTSRRRMPIAPSRMT